MPAAGSRHVGAAAPGRPLLCRPRSPRRSSRASALLVRGLGPARGFQGRSCRPAQSRRCCQCTGLRLLSAAHSAGQSVGSCRTSRTGPRAQLLRPPAPRAHRDRVSLLPALICENKHDPETWSVSVHRVVGGLAEGPGVRGAEWAELPACPVCRGGPASVCLDLACPAAFLGPSHFLSFPGRQRVPRRGPAGVCHRAASTRTDMLAWDSEWAICPSGRRACVTTRHCRLPGHPCPEPILGPVLADAPSPWGRAGGGGARRAASAVTVTDTGRARACRACREGQPGPGGAF